MHDRSCALHTADAGGPDAAVHVCMFLLQLLVQARDEEGRKYLPQAHGRLLWLLGSLHSCLAMSTFLHARLRPSTIRSSVCTTHGDNR